jgi:hypothetical protein
MRENDLRYCSTKQAADANQLFFQPCPGMYWRLPELDLQPALAKITAHTASINHLLIPQFNVHPANSKQTRCAPNKIGFYRDDARFSG